MNRRQFIRNTSLAAAFVGVAPLLPAFSDKPKKKKKIIFVFRGVSYQDGFQAFKSFNLASNHGFHIQKVVCNNPSYTHQHGMMILLRGINKKKTLVQRSELSENSSFTQLITGAMSNSTKHPVVVHLHHTEIGHSSNKMYKERLIDFFKELSVLYNQEIHDVIITADIGRNEKLNSCGGRDHSNATSLETFSIYLGENASKLSTLGETILQDEVLKQKF